VTAHRWQPGLLDDVGYPSDSEPSKRAGDGLEDRRRDPITTSWKRAGVLTGGDGVEAFHPKTRFADVHKRLWASGAREGRRADSPFPKLQRL
jgi:hypothetical protein